MEPNLQFLNKETAEKYRQMIESDFLWKDWKPSAETVESGVVVPASSFCDEFGNYRYLGGVLNAEGSFVDSSGLYKDSAHNRAPLSMAECPFVDIDKCEFIDEEVIYYGIFIYHWGHFLFESTSRLWYYLKNECKAKGHKLVAICPGKKPDGNFRLFHELLGITPDDIIFVDKPTKFRKIIIPNVSCMLSNDENKEFRYSEEFLVPFDAVKNSVPDSYESKIYLTRTALQMSNSIGEQHIEENFAKNGFRVISPEKISLIELVSILKNAEQVAGLSGSNTHNLLFAKDGCRSIILNRFSDTNYPQEMVHKARRLDAVYVDVYATFMPVTHGNGPFLVSVNENLFNFQIIEGMVPYNYCNSISKDTVVEFLRLWGKINRENKFAAAAFENIYQYSPEDFINRVDSFFVSNEKTGETLSKHKYKYLLWLHKQGLKKIFESINTDKSRLTDLNVIKFSYYFNEKWYKKKYMQGIEDIDPALHYLLTGFKEKNDPSPRFSTEGYLELYPDIRQGEINPLWHYEKHGKFEGRSVTPSGKMKRVNAVNEIEKVSEPEKDGVEMDITIKTDIKSDLKYLYESQYEKFSIMIGQNYLYDKPLEVDYIDKGIVFPSTGYTDENGNYKYKGGVVDKEGNFVENSGLYKTPDRHKHALTMTENPEYRVEDVQTIDETVVYSGIFIYHWGHFLFECTTRLWYYLKNNCKEKGIKLAIACVSNKPDANFKQFYSLLGIEKKDIIFIDRPTRFTQVIVPEYSSVLGYYYTEDFLMPFNRILDAVEAEKHKKVYITRSKLNPNNTIGEDEIEKCFAINGYSIIAPEQMSLSKMVSILKGAEIVAGLSGSNTHNLLFSRPGIRAMIMNRFGECNNPQELVHKARGINAEYVDAFSTFLPVTHGGGPFLVSVNDNLYNWLKDNKMKADGYSKKQNPEKVVEFLTEWAKINHDDFKTAILCEHYSMKDCVETIYRFFGQ